MRARQLAWGVAAAVVGGAAHARADEVGYQVDHYEPTPAGDPFFYVEAPWYAATRRLAVDLTFDYAHDLVAAQHRDAAGNLIGDPAPIADASAAHLDLALAVTARVALTASLPLVLDQAGTAFAGVGPSGTTAGDPRLGARARLWGSDGAAALDAAAYVWIPVGAEDHLAGDASVRGLGRLSASGLAGERVRWAINASLYGRKTAVLSSTATGGNAVGSEAELAAAVDYLAGGGRLSVGPEAIASLALFDLPPAEDRATLEVLGAVRWSIDDRYTLGVGAGGAVAGGPAPDARVLVTLAYAPGASGAPRGSRIERVIVLPDDDGHVGAVEVDDGKHKTLLDKAYAASEITRDTKAVRPVPASRETLPPAAAALAKSLPPPDRDGDGVADAIDACPDRAGAPSVDPLRNGCPAAAEKVIVLPDEDGHVGGVEIDDGRGTTVLDHAYASAEVATDGQVEAVPPAPPKTIDRAIAAVAAALPPPDADGDGIHDLDDACPDTPGVASKDPLRNGCPAAAERVIVVPDADGHVGGVEIDDGHGTTVLDHAYASADVGADGRAQLEPPTTQGRSIDRAIAAIAKTLPIEDEDGDGVPDARDACPERAGVASPDPLRDGCPRADEKVIVVPDADGHVGAVEVDDGTHQVLLDKAYASAEVAGGQVSAAPSGATIALVRATAAMARTLPAPDRDDDGIADADDACPDRAGPPSPTPARNGCPKTVEQIVVLPDENGAVGAVEVDDGTTTTLLDKAYASADIGDDGKTHALPAEPSEVSARYAEALAARPPGARIILYFTAGSAPARDLAGPIDNLVAEVKAKGTFDIDVIGHTDQTGSEKQNVKIGLQRAQVIADKLIAAGVPAEHVHVSSKGSSEPAVKRASRRVVELRNRRVEVWVR